MGDKLEITKLTKDNYPTWKFKAKHLLTAKGLFGYVDGSETAPGSSASADDKKQYQSGRAKAHSHIVLSVSDELLYLITECEDAKDTWEKLQSHFERDSLANRLFLKKKYFRTVMSENASIESHLKDMKEITNKLAAIKAPVSEEDQVVTLLGSLPESFDTLVTALEAHGDRLTLEFVSNALLNEEQKRSEEQRLPATAGISSSTSHNVKSDAALSVEAKTADSSQVRGCYICNSPNHYMRFCPQNKSRGRGRGGRYRGRGGHTQHLASTASADDEIAFLVPESKSAVNDDAVQQPWVIDSGASSHMCQTKDVFTEYTTLDNPEYVTVADGSKVQGIARGSVRLSVRVSQTKQRTVTLKNVLHVPALNGNLLSVKAATQNDYVVQFGRNRCWVKNQRSMVIAKGTLVNKLYYLDLADIDHTANVASGIDIWHKRLAHAGISTLKRAHNESLVDGADLSSVSFDLCGSCVKGKMARLPFQSSGIKSKRTLELVHTDVCGEMQTNSLGGRKYFVSFIDDFSRYAHVYFLCNKSDVFSAFQDYKAKVETQTGNRIATLRSDQGGEYLSHQFSDFLRVNGIQHQLTARYTPQQNGCAERYNRTVCESARAMIIEADVPKSFWAEAIATSVYVRNRLPTAAIRDHITPYERWYGKKPNISNARVFGSLAYAHIPDELRQKLDVKADVMMFVGYSEQSKAYRLYDPVSKQVVVRRDVICDESKLGIPQAGKSEPDTLMLDLSPHDGVSLPGELRRSSRDTKRPIRFGIDEFCNNAEHHAPTDNVFSEPSSFADAMSCPEANHWVRAANEEYKSLIDMNTWDLVPLPPGRQSVSCKWVFKLKSNSDGSVDRYKARLVARGFTQQQGVDFDETYAPVVHRTSLRALLSYGFSRNMIIHQMDVVTAFLNGKLAEHIYMTQPEGFVTPGSENLVCKLKRSLYGLKQSPRCWNLVLDQYLKSLGFSQSSADQCVYIRNDGGQQTLLAVYVDDIVILSDSEKSMHDIKSSLSQKFKMKDLGPIHYVLGISVAVNDESLKMYQPNYIYQTLRKYKMYDCNPVHTPMTMDVKLCTDDGSQPADKSLYQSLIGSLLYLSTATRPDIAYAVSVLSRFTVAPTETHLTAAKRVLRYLKFTPELGISYSRSGSKPVGYSDSSWADDDTRHSTSGVVFMYAGGPVLWLSKRQSVVALSTAEAEYVAAFDATREAAWLRQLYLDITGCECTPLTLYIDNTSAICIANNSATTKRSKHMDVRYHYVREEVNSLHIKTVHCPTVEMIADILTKPVPRPRYDELRSKLGVA